MKKIYVIWTDYDGVYINSFVNDKGKNLKANRFINKLNKKAESADNYGTNVIAIITGQADYSIKETKNIS